MTSFFKKKKLSLLHKEPACVSSNLEENSQSPDEVKSFKRSRLKMVIIITAIVMGIEVVGGFLTNSLALLSDAGHMLTHLFALGMSFFAIVLAARPVTKEKTYGFYRAEILVAFVNGIVLLFLTAFIFYKAIQNYLSSAGSRVADALSGYFGFSSQRSRNLPPARNREGRYQCEECFSSPYR